MAAGLYGPLNLGEVTLCIRCGDFLQITGNNEVTVLEYGMLPAEEQ